MTTRQDLPEPWASALVQAGLVDPRYADDRPSISRLSEASGVHKTTISAMIAGSREPRQENVEAVATALRLSPAVVSQWLGRKREGREPFTPHRDADLLGTEERRAVNEMIRLLARDKRKRRDREATQAGRDEYELAARRTRSGGPSAGQARRQHLDALGEHPQDEGPEDGA